MYRLLVKAFVLAGVALCGCAREAATERETVVASAAGRVLTAHELEARANNIALLFAHREGMTNRMAKIREVYRRGYAKHWVEEAALAKAAEEVKVVPNGEQLETARQNAWVNFKAKGDKAYEDLLSIPGFDRARWEAVVHHEALKLAMKAYWVANDLPEVPAGYAEGVIKRILARNVELGVTNRLQYAKATNVWQKIVGGADFVTVAKAETELPEEVEDDCEWAVLDDRLLAEEPALRAWVKAAKPGDVSPPLAADGGVLIVRLDRLEADDCVALSRVYIRLADVRPPAGKAEIEAAWRDREGEALFGRKLAECVASANPEIKEISEAGKKEREVK